MTVAVDGPYNTNKETKPIIVVKNIISPRIIAIWHAYFGLKMTESSWEPVANLMVW